MKNARLIMDYCEVVYHYYELNDYIAECNDLDNILEFLYSHDYDYYLVDKNIYDIKIHQDIIFTITKNDNDWYLNNYVDFITYDCDNINTTIQEIEKTLSKMLDNN